MTREKFKEIEDKFGKVRDKFYEAKNDVAAIDECSETIQKIRKGVNEEKIIVKFDLYKDDGEIEEIIEPVFFTYSQHGRIALEALKILEEELKALELELETSLKELKRRLNMESV